MTEILFTESARVSQSERTAARVVGGKAVVVVIDTQKLHVMSDVGTRIWELADGRTLSQIVDAVVEEYEVERAQAQADAVAFVRELVGIGAVHVDAP